MSLTPETFTRQLSKLKLLRFLSTFLAIAVAQSGFITSVLADSSAKKKASGSLEVTVKVKEPMPPQTMQVIDDTQYCGVDRTLKNFLIDHDNDLKNAVVWLQPDHPMALDHNYHQNEIVLQDCEAHPRIIIVSSNQPVRIMNRDKFAYHLRTVSKRNPSMSFPFPPNLKQIKMRFDVPEIVGVLCDIHPWVKAYVVVASNSFYAKTDEKGQVRFEHLPQGTYRVFLWHELLGEKQLEDPVVIDQSEEKRIVEWE